MSNVNTSVNKSEDASSDGEDDFESADEGEGKEKVGTTSSSDGVVNVQRNCDETAETENIRITGNLSKGMRNIDLNEPNLDTNKSIQTSDLKSTENILAAAPSLPVDADIASSYDDNRSGATANETKERIDASSSAAGNPAKIKNEEQSNAAESTSGGWGWGSWGAVLNQATTTMTSGLSQVIEKVETTLGIPEPGELQDEAFSKDEKNEVITMEPKADETDKNPEGRDNSAGTNGSTSESFFSSWGLASLSNAVTSKGIELVSEGIDALETIGKKTMDVISEGDPGFRVKRDIFKKPSLSQVLREAKEEHAKESVEKKTQEVLEKVNFNDEFDRYQGLAHLEALEILSRECEAKIESVLIDLFEDDLEKAKGKLRAIEDVFGKASADEEEREESLNAEFAVEIGKYAMALNLAFVPNRLNQTEELISKWLEECAKDQETSVNSHSPDNIYSHVITSLADITAKSIEVFRKVAEMILVVEDKDNTVTSESRASHLFSITKVVTNRISSLSTSYAKCLNAAVNQTEDIDNLTPLITEVYLECSNSSSHVQDAFKLLMPVLQVSALNSIE